MLLQLKLLLLIHIAAEVAAKFVVVVKVVGEGEGLFAQNVKEGSQIPVPVTLNRAMKART